MSIFNFFKKTPQKTITTNKNIEPRLTEDGLEMIKLFEGEELKVYLDVAGYPTVGYGHLVQPGDNLELGDTISKEQADNFLRSDIKKAESYVKKHVKVPINNEMYSALVSFVYNVGVHNFINSTMLKLLNSDKLIEAAEQFDRWIYAKGKPYKGLEIRRATEKKMFINGVTKLLST